MHIAAACEAVTFAKKLGLDLPTVYKVITASAGNSWMFENRVPHILDGDYAPRSAVEIFTKDLGIVSDMGRREKFPLQIAATALQMFLMTAAAGMERDDDASVARMIAENDRPRTAGCFPLAQGAEDWLKQFEAGLARGFCREQLWLDAPFQPEAIHQGDKHHGDEGCINRQSPGVCNVLQGALNVGAITGVLLAVHLEQGRIIGNLAPERQPDVQAFAVEKLPGKHRVDDVDEARLWCCGHAGRAR